LNIRPSWSKVITLADTEMPRSRSIFIQSDRVRRDSPRAHLAGRADRPAGQQQVLGQGGLAGVGVGDDGEGAPARSLRGGRGP
jgi:hypothetical protein